MPSLLGHVLFGHVTYAMSRALAGLIRDMGHEMKLCKSIGTRIAMSQRNRQAFIQKEILPVSIRISL